MATKNPPQLTKQSLQALPRPLRLALSLDASFADEAALHLAVDIARILRAELHGLLVENARLIQWASSSFGSEICSATALERQLQPESLRRSQCARRRQTEEQLSRLADAAKVSWSLTVVQQECGRDMQAVSGFDLLVLGKRRGSGMQSLNTSAATSPRHSVLWWVNDELPLDVSQSLLTGLLAPANSEVYLIAANPASERLEALSNWLESRHQRYFRLSASASPDKLQTQLRSLRVSPSFAVLPATLDSSVIGELVSRLNCPVLISGAVAQSSK